MADRPLAVWHAAPISRVIGAVVGVAFGGALVLVSLGALGSTTATANRLVFGLVGLVVLAMTADFTLRLRIELSEQALTVVNAVRTTVIPLRDVQNVQATRYGLMIVWDRDGDSKQTCASAVYKSAVPGAGQLRGARADQAVERIQAACERASSD